MYITKLNLKNLKRLRDVSLDFTHEGKPRMWTVFVAENGACKTTLLQSVALAASGPARSNQLADVPSLPDLRRPIDSVGISAEFAFGSRQAKWRRLPAGIAEQTDEDPLRLVSHLFIEAEQLVFTGASIMGAAGKLPPLGPISFPTQLNPETTSNLFEKLKVLAEHPNQGDFQTAFSSTEMLRMLIILNSVAGVQDPISQARSRPFPGWFVSGYGTQRQLPVPLGAPEAQDHILNRLEPLFGKAPLTGTGFASQFANTRFFEPFIQTLQRILVGNQLLPHVDAIELRGRGGISQPGDLIRSHNFEFSFSGHKTKVPATWLSQGYQSTIAWIADLVGQMYLDLGDPVPLEDMEGIVLVDELDLHLHPSWQVRLVPVLKRVFPRMQFIVTTHSPMLLPALERHEIVMLRLDESGDVVAEPPPASPKLMTGSEIYSSFFNIQKLYPNELGDELRRYTYLSSDPTRTDAEDAEMLGLQKKLTEAGLDLGLPPVPRDLT